MSSTKSSNAPSQKKGKGASTSAPSRPSDGPSEGTNRPSVTGDLRMKVELVRRVNRAVDLYNTAHQGKYEVKIDDGYLTIDGTNISWKWSQSQQKGEIVLGDKRKCGTFPALHRILRMKDSSAPKWVVDVLMKLIAFDTDEISLTLEEQLEMIEHPERFQKGPPKRRQMPSPEGVKKLLSLGYKGKVTDEMYAILEAEAEFVSVNRPMGLNEGKRVPPKSKEVQKAKNGTEMGSRDGIEAKVAASNGNQKKTMEVEESVWPDGHEPDIMTPEMLVAIKPRWSVADVQTMVIKGERTRQAHLRILQSDNDPKTSALSRVLLAQAAQVNRRLDGEEAGTGTVESESSTEHVEPLTAIQQALSLHNLAYEDSQFRDEHGNVYRYFKDKKEIRLTSDPTRGVLPTDAHVDAKVVLTVL